MGIINLNDELKRLFPETGDAQWRIADKALYVLSPKDRALVLNLYCRKCGDRTRLDLNYNELPCSCNK